MTSQISQNADELAHKEVAEAMSRLLADTYALYLKTHGYHWNVTGPMFPVLHTMFERQYLELQAAVDPIAERIRALGQPAPGSLSDISRLASVPEQQAWDAIEMVRDLARAHQVVVQTAQDVLASAERTGDVVSADLAISRLQLHELEIWMLEAASA